jgi:hypothetical protein
MVAARDRRTGSDRRSDASTRGAGREGGFALRCGEEGEREKRDGRERKQKKMKLFV